MPSALCRPLFLLLYHPIFLLSWLSLPPETAFGLLGLLLLTILSLGFLWQDPPLPKKYQRQYYPKPRWKRKITAYCRELITVAKNLIHCSPSRRDSEQQSARQQKLRKKRKRISLSLFPSRTRTPYPVVRQQ
jgi:hypothetical protein